MHPRSRFVQKRTAYSRLDLIEGEVYLSSGCQSYGKNYSSNQKQVHTNKLLKKMIFVRQEFGLKHRCERKKCPN